MLFAVDNDPKSLALATQRAAAVLRAGKLVAFPTETVYGLGANALNAVAVAGVFEAKERPSFDPLIVHLGSADWLDRVVASISQDARKLAARFWPGPLTLVLPKRACVPDIVTSGLPTVAVRVPAHPIAHAMIIEADLPIAAPSANRFGRISPTTAQAVAEELGDRVELIIDGGPTIHGIESTIVGFGETGPRLLRPGPITLEELRECLGCEVSVPTRVAPDAVPAESPGQLASHYAPRTPLRLLQPGLNFSGRVGLLSFSGALPAESFAMVEVLSKRGDMREAAANLFAAMRRLDAAGLDLIIAEPMTEAGVGRAVMDRLRRAAAN